MSKKYSRDSRSSLPPGADDFQRIDGVGPGIERRLHSAGVLTYAQLGERSPESLLPLVDKIVGMSAELIAEQDWPGQARALAREQNAQQARADDSRPPGRAQAERDEPYRSPYTTFTVELLIDDDKMVRRTRAKHVQSEQEDSWAGWQTARLLAFFACHAELQQEADEQAAFPIETPVEIAAPTSQIAAPIEVSAPPAGEPPARSRGAELSGRLELSEAAVLSPDRQASRQLIRAGEAFRAAIALDLSGVERPVDAKLRYLATLVVKQLGSGLRMTVGQVSGVLPPGDRADIELEGQALARGKYRLEAAVTLALPDRADIASGSIAALRESGVLHVY